MVWLLLLAACSAVVATTSWLAFKRTWAAILLTALLAPYIYLQLAWALSGQADAQDGLVLVFGQVVAIPVAVIVSAVLAGSGDWKRRGRSS